MFAAVLILACGAEPVPQYSVTNKTTPQFEVVNKIPVTRVTDYERIYARILAGERVSFTAPLSGFPGEPGEYVGYLSGGVPVMERKVVSRGASPFDGATDCPPGQA